MTRALTTLFVASMSACGFEPGTRPSIDATEPDSDGESRDAAADAATDVAPACAGYTAAATSKYRLVTAPVGWIVAEMDCEDDEPGGSHLAIVGSETERADIDALVTVEVWIGLVDRKIEGTWVWVDGSAHTINQPPWKAGEPSNGANDDCAMIETAGLYDAVSCTDNKQYICECDGIATMPAAYTP